MDFYFSQNSNCTRSSARWFPLIIFVFLVYISNSSRLCSYWSLLVGDNCFCAYNRTLSPLSFYLFDCLSCFSTLFVDLAIFLQNRSWRLLNHRLKPGAPSSLWTRCLLRLANLLLRIQRNQRGQEGFRQTYKKEHPNNKFVAAVSVISCDLVDVM